MVAQFISNKVKDISERLCSTLKEGKILEKLRETQELAKDYNFFKELAFEIIRDSSDSKISQEEVANCEHQLA